MILYSIVTLITAGAGIKFLIATEYFGYHAQASGVEWSQVESGLQYLVIAGFKIIGAGFVTVAISFVGLIIFPFATYDQRWSYYVIPMSGILFWSIILVTTIKVSSVTGAMAPWQGSLFCVLALLVGFIVSLVGPRSYST